MDTETKNIEIETDNDVQPSVIDEQPAKKERKPLSPEEIQKRKKMLIYPLMGLAFILVMYLIFAPSKADKEKAEAAQGLNVEIPSITGGELPDDKETAYKQAEIEINETERQSAMGELSDFFGGTQQADNRQDEWKPVAESEYNSTHPNEIRQSATAYGDIRHTLGNFYEDNSQVEALQQQIDDLQAQLEERNSATSENEEIQKQLELMEKSYEMAAKYLPQNQQATPVNPFETAIERGMNDPIPNAHTKSEAKEPTFTVSPDTKNIVSSLYQEVSDSVFIAEQMQERNRSFISATEIANETPEKNTLKVSVHETVTLKDGETVRLRLLETARVANLHLPKNKILTATAKIQGNRLTLSVTHIEQQGRIIAVNLSAFDLDGQPGVFIPNSEEMNAVKEVVAGMGQSAGTSFTFNSSAGQQLAADAGKGVMQGASQYLNKKMREVKVTVKAGHLLFLTANK